MTSAEKHLLIRLKTPITNQRNYPTKSLTSRTNKFIGVIYKNVYEVLRMGTWVTQSSGTSLKILSQHEL